MTRFGGPIRVGLLTPYFAFFEARFPADFRQTQAAYADGLARALADAGLGVTASGLVDGAEAAAEARARFEAAGVDVVVACATMAAPPTYGTGALEGYDGPIIVWDDRRAYYLVGGYDDAADSANATALAMWSAVRFTSEVLHLPVFDFEGSMVPAVERFFRKFGGALLPTYTVSWTRPVSTPTRIARRVRRLVARD